MFHAHKDLKGYDRLLWPFLRSRSAWEGEQCFQQLWDLTLEKEVRSILKRTRLTPEDLDDLTQDTFIQLWRDLCARHPDETLFPSPSFDDPVSKEGEGSEISDEDLKAKADDAESLAPNSGKATDKKPDSDEPDDLEEAKTPISNVCAYARRIAANLSVNLCRKRKPRWRRLKQFTMTVLKADRRFYLSGKPSQQACGFSAWQDMRRRHSPVGPEFLERDDVFRRRYLRNRDPREVAGAELEGLGELIEAIFLWLNAPLPLNEMVYLLARLLQIDDPAPRSLDDPENGDAQSVPSGEESPLERLIREELLVKFGRFVCRAKLKRCERGAVSLNLERDFLLGGLQIRLGELAVALGFSASPTEMQPDFIEKVWRHIPLSDDGIAEALDVQGTDRTSPRGIISGARMTALRRKWPAWLREGNG